MHFTQRSLGGPLGESSCIIIRRLFEWRLEWWLSSEAILWGSLLFELWQSCPCYLHWWCTAVQVLFHIPLASLLNYTQSAPICCHGRVMVWHKTTHETFVSPIMESLSQFSTLGISISTSHGLRTFCTKLVMGLFDLIAKRDVLCAKQFNGKYGCSVCLNTGTLISRNTRAYLPGDFELRTHRTVVTAAKEAERKGEAVQGIISTSPMTSTIDLVDCIPIDCMHAVSEGVTCTLRLVPFKQSWWRILPWKQACRYW